MAKQVFSNAVILEGEELEVVRGYLIVRDDVVERISEGSPLARATDLKGGFVIPPFVNSHTHVMDSVAKEFYLGKTQPEVVGPEGEKFRVLSSSSVKDLTGAAKATLMDMLRTGTVAHCDFREGGLEGVKLMRSVSLPPLRSIIMGRPLDLDELPEVLAEADGVGLPSLDEFSWKNLVEIANQIHRANKLLSVHVAETKAAQEASMKSRGVGEVEQALRLRPTFVVHATHADEREFLLLRKKNVPVVFCPRANNLLGTGSPPIHTALTVGAKFCFGTDNVMVSQPNMFEELSFAWALLRGADHSAGGGEARELLRAATVEPTKVFGLPWGGICEGGKATFLILARRENLFGISDVYSGLVNRARPDNLRAVYVNGKEVFGQSSKK